MTDPETTAHAEWDAGNLRAAFAHFREGAIQESEGCMLCLGYFYDEGLGTTRSKHMAMHWHKKANQAGSSSAATNVAILFRERRNYRAMYRWYQIAARAGDGDAQVEQAKCQLVGLGTPRAHHTAIIHLRKAINSKCITAVGREEARSLFLARSSPNPSIEMTSPGKPGAASHLKR